MPGTYALEPTKSGILRLWLMAADYNAVCLSPEGPQWVTSTATRSPGIPEESRPSSEPEQRAHRKVMIAWPGCNQRPSEKKGRCGLAVVVDPALPMTAMPITG